MRKGRSITSLGRRRHDYWTVRLVRVELLPILVENAGAMGTHEFRARSRKACLASASPTPTLLIPSSEASLSAPFGVANGPVPGPNSACLPPSMAARGSAIWRRARRENAISKVLGELAATVRWDGYPDVLIKKTRP